MKNKNKMPEHNFRKADFKISPQTVELLKKAWNDLPPDFTVGERSLFIEVAERLVKIADASHDHRIN